MTEPNKDHGIYAGNQPRPTPRADEPSEDEPAPLPSLARGGKSSGLKSLAQSARGNQLQTARNWLLFVGIITVLANAAFLFFQREAIMTELRRQGIQQMPPGLMTIAYIITGALIFSGVVFIVLGLLVKKFPLPCTIIGLVLYVAMWLGTGLLDPAQFLYGIIIKLIIIAALVKAIQSAWAYETERQAEQTAADFEN
jgi:hypothetical protein